MHDIYVKVKAIETDPRKSKYAKVNRLRVGVDHQKGRGVAMSIFPAEETIDGIISIIVTDGEYTTLEVAERLSRKKVEKWYEEALAAIGCKGHPIQRLIDGFCYKRGLIADES